MFVKVVLVFGLCFCSIKAQETVLNFENDVTDANYDRQDGPPQYLDAVGNIINLMDRFLTRSFDGQQTPNEKNCQTSFHNISGVEIKVSAQPRGDCSYCCPVTNPLKHLGLIFTSKEKNGKPVFMRMIRRAGMLRAAGLNSNIPTVIYIHGFMEDGLGAFPRAIRDAYLSRDEDTNILLVDWGELTPFPWYPQAVQHTKTVGILLGKFIKFYNKTGELPISKLHVVGFSLGAHVASFIGKSMKGFQKLPRITGLDPALPMFPLGDPSERISKRDAEYVDVIHTDGGKFGMLISLGDADFYPNGGTYIQPGCEPSNLVANQLIQYLGWCSHSRAVHFYAESVRNPKAFPAVEYDDNDVTSRKSRRLYRRQAFDVFMGFSANKTSAKGNFYLTTNNHAPYGRSIKI